MREKIADLIDRQSGGNLSYCQAVTDQIFTSIYEEIEKVENPYLSDSEFSNFVGFERARREILALLRK